MCDWQRFGTPVVDRTATILYVRIIPDMDCTYHNKISGGKNLHYQYVCLGCIGKNNNCVHSHSYLCLRIWIYIQKGLVGLHTILMPGSTDLPILIFTYYI
jgi:hypothetical protein